ncbi:hypothetical protein M422DRAFT_128241, partial [Sphaerobolus stellatus SS14]
WSQATMAFTQDWVTHYLKRQEKAGTNIPIPKLLYVSSAIITFQELTSEKITLIAKQFMDGKFVKCIGNQDPIPFQSLKGEERNIAKYLSFSQHLHYVESNSESFLSDFQGELHSTSKMLTDCQCIANLDLFGDGNLDTAWREFPAKHKCNTYCSYFG